MQKTQRRSVRGESLALAALVLIAGCQGQSPPDSGGSADRAGAAAGIQQIGASDVHHGHQTPHGGHLIELGTSHSYHAELVDNHETETLTVYILDADLQPTSITQENILLNLAAGGQVTPVELQAVDAGEGKTAKFASRAAEAFEMLDRAEVTGTLRVTIDGTPYTGRLTHHRHGHEHGSHEHGSHEHGSHEH